MAEEAAAAAAPIADAGAGNVDTPNLTPDSSAESSSTPGVLTPEERDNQTIARLLGTETPTTEASPTDADGASGTAEDDADDAGDDAPADEGTATNEAEDGADDDVEITPEILEALIDALGEDALVDHPRLKAKVEALAKSDADRRFEERQRTQTVSQEQELLVQQGRTAVTNLFELGTKAAAELAKAERGEEFDAKAVDPQEIEKNLRSYGSAVVLEVKRGFDNAFTSGFTQSVSVGGPLTEEEKQAVVGIVQTANRIENDPAQGSDAAKAHLFAETMKFVANRAKEAGKAEALASVQKRKDAVSKILGDGGENAVKAAVAKIAKTKKNLPTKPVAASPQPDTSTDISVDSYRAAKKAGDYAKADQIAAALSARG